MLIYSIFKAVFSNMLDSGTARQDSEKTERTLQNVIICKTNDEVSIDLARTWCDEDGLVFQLAGQGDRLFPAGGAAMVIDLNHLALRPIERAQLVDRLAKVLPPYPVGIASYDLEPEMMDTLKARGMLVFRRIERQLFYDLAKASWPKRSKPVSAFARRSNWTSRLPKREIT